MTKEKRKGGIILQVAILFALSIVAMGIITFFTLRVRTDTSVKQQAETRSAEIANEVSLAVREYPAYPWLLRYWYEHWDSMEIEYDVDFYGGIETEAKYRDFKERNPDFQLKYMDPEEVESLSEEDQRLYAEICYSWLITRVNQIKQTHRIDYLFCVLTEEPFDTQFFLFSAADPDSARGTDYEEVYPLGNVARDLGPSQQEAMRGAMLHSSHLADAGDYVDYYAYLCEVDGHVVLIGLTYSLADLRASIDAQTWRETFSDLAFQVILSLICMGLMSLFVLRPLKKIQHSIRLYERTKDSESVAEDLKEIRTRNEIGELSEDVVKLTRELDQYVSRVETITAERERITTELALATRLQAAFLPHEFPPFPERNEFEIYASMDPAREVGGDFYDYFLIDEDHLCLVMADVSGKGIPAALFMMVCKIVLQNCAMLGKSAAETLARTNEGICAHNQEEMFVTVWLGILEISTGRLRAANAGHEYPVIKRPDGSFELLKDRHGLVIGAMDSAKYREYELMLEPGTKLFLYTDGVPEATDAEERMFGMERMLDALNTEPDAKPERILQNVRASVNGFVKEAEQFDDLTMLCMEYRGKDESNHGN
jgi:serine phosphatase RsbU (regulator of sigma subunit)